MQTFLLSPEGFNEFRKKIILRVIPLGAIALAVGVYIAVANQNEDADTSMVEILPFIIPIFLLALGFGIFMSIKRQKAGWDSFQLTIEEDVITRTQDNMPEMKIRKEEIQEIFEVPSGNLVIKSDKQLHFIGIPASVQNREELLKLLETFGEIHQEPAKSNKGLLTIIASLAVLGLMGAFFIAKSKALIIPTGILLAAGLIWAFIQTQKSKLVDKKTKRNSYFIFLVIFSIIAKLVIAI